MGKFFAQTIASAVRGSLRPSTSTGGRRREIFAYSYAMLFGSVVLGFGAVGFMARMPEPKMVVPAGERPSVFAA